MSESTTSRRVLLLMEADARHGNIPFSIFPAVNPEPLLGTNLNLLFLLFPLAPSRSPIWSSARAQHLFHQNLVGSQIVENVLVRTSARWQVPLLADR